MYLTANLAHGFFFLVVVFIIPYLFVVIFTILTWATYIFGWGSKKEVPRKHKERNTKSAAASVGKLNVVNKFIYL